MAREEGIVWERVHLKPGDHCHCQCRGEKGTHSRGIWELDRKWPWRCIRGGIEGKTLMLVQKRSKTRAGSETVETAGRDRA